MYPLRLNGSQSPSRSHVARWSSHLYVSARYYALEIQERKGRRDQRCPNALHKQQGHDLGECSPHVYGQHQ